MSIFAQNCILKSAENGDYEGVSSLLLSLQLNNRVGSELIKKERVDNPLVLAAKSGNLKLVKFMIEEFGFDKESVGTVLFSEDEDHILEAPVLWTAATAGHLPIVKYLVSSGCCVNRPTKTGSTPIRGACYDGYLEVVTYLVKHGGNFNTPNENGQSPLLVASGMNHIKIVKYLIWLGADLNTQAVKGLTALHIACERNYVDVALLLTEAGAKLLKDEQGASPLMLAAISGHEKTLNALLLRIPEHQISTESLADLLTVMGCSLYDRGLQVQTNTTHSAAIRYWCRAVKLRDSLPPQVLSRLAMSRVTLPEVYGEGAHEPLTKCELEKVLPDSYKVSLFTLVARERILGPSHYLIYFLRLRTAIDLDRQQYERSLILLDRSIHLSYTALASDSNRHPYLDQATFILQCHGKAYRDKKCSITTVFFEWITIQIELFCSNFFDRISNEKVKNEEDESLVKLWLHELVILLELNNHEYTNRVEELIQRVAQLEYRSKARGSSVLHIACTLDTAAFDINSQLMGPLWPNLSCLKLLCRYFNLEAVDSAGCTPLHISIQNTTDSYLRYTTAELLLENGAHPDTLSLIGESPADCETAISFNKDCSIRNLLWKHIPLKCQAARVLGRNVSRYQERIPHGLLYFLSLHTTAATV